VSAVIPPSAYEHARQVLRTHQAELMAKENVVGCGVGLRQVQGVRTGEVALVVMVSRKLPHHELNPQDILPAELEGVPVDVQEVGDLRAF
jgi:hypothetical protein